VRDDEQRFDPVLALQFGESGVQCARGRAQTQAGRIPEHPRLEAGPVQAIEHGPEVLRGAADAVHEEHRDALRVVRFEHLDPRSGALAHGNRGLRRRLAHRRGAASCQREQDPDSEQCGGTCERHALSIAPRPLRLGHRASTDRLR